MIKTGLSRLLLAACALFLARPAAAATPEGIATERLLMDAGWKFHLGNDWGPGYGLAKAGTGYGPGSPTYSDASWRAVDLPHDWAIELPFDPTADGSHGFHAIGEGFPQNSVGWYRRSFTLPAADAGKRIWVEFDGVYRDTTVIVNGWFVGHHESGYSGFRYDITDLVDVGAANAIAVRVDATLPEGWFYEGAGIYRHVWLVKRAPLAVAPDGVFVYSHFHDNVPKGPAEVHVQARLLNAGDRAADATVSWEVFAPGGGAAGTAGTMVRVLGGQTSDVEKRIRVETPQLWSPEHPHLYTLVTTVLSGGRMVDKIETPFGIRTVGFDADRGFLLNGEPYVLKGTSDHQDHAGVGSALPDALQSFRVARLKDLGSNAIRTAHNPPTPELLDACDRLGMLVMDENRQLGSDARHLALVEEQVRRDRNHASVAIWSIGNEEFAVERTVTGQRVATSVQEFLLRLDHTRPVTINADLGNVYTGVDAAVQVRGWSYHVGPDMDAYHKEHPTQPNVGSEQGSTVSTRGIYANDPVRGYVSAYDDNAPPWAQTAETWLTFFGSRPWMSGGFVWTGFDYRGEPTPYEWPCINSHFGIMDTCGFPKDNFWFYKSWWSDETVLHILPHWNWPGTEGQNIDVRTQSNCDEVELLVNGRSLGRLPTKRFSEIKWTVPYAPGSLTARGFRGGRQVAETKVETTAEPAALHLDVDRAVVAANGEDAAVFTVSVVDSQGRVVPTAGNKLTFELEGPGRIIGVGNGDPSCHEPDTFLPTTSSRSLPVDGWRWGKVADPYLETLPEAAPAYDDSAWDPTDVNADTGPVPARGKAVIRTHVNLAAADLDSHAVELAFGKVVSGVAVFVNGTKVTSGSIDSHASAIFNVKAYLHPGDNVIAVPIDNYGPDGSGLTRGVVLRLQAQPLPPHWGRSAFNGLAEVIVQTTREAGTVRLVAKSDGLEQASFALKALAAAPRPAAP